ncbi:4,5-DOPA dioxygenase extradiol [Chitinophaga filiformis]|uniref:4,5-DOPA-extradiol-dioxygenase n=1 Tax=Chitinophaga filiformis TaxID=104663 RepID=UPI001F25455C|nr:4,5-DOPA dioxygenase extradiol [Chitinophaga filiformis]MCF6405839.1 4,5-DOPA dioxygenase extradiol [Chitinophaga filiformis]
MNRKDFLAAMAVLPVGGLYMQLQELGKITRDYQRTTLMPAMFIGHGNPMNALYDNAFTRRLKEMGESVKQLPNAILVVSAHWLTRGTHVLTAARPATIHDFGGFPQALHEVQYPAPGSPELARETAKLIKSTQVVEDEEWGLDHGTWTVLKHMYPEANIPVFQLSIDYYKPPAYHYQLAQELKELRKRGVLIVGSGNIVHNLRRISFSDNAAPFDWALEFDATVKRKTEERSFDDLLHYERLGEAAKLSIPTPDHYFPFIYGLGLAEPDEEIRFTYEEIQNGSISMRCFQVGE